METEFDKKAYKKEEKQVEKLKKFYYHSAIFLVVNMFLVALNLYQTPNYLWCLWVIFGWGIGVVMNAFSVFFFSKE